MGRRRNLIWNKMVFQKIVVPVHENWPQVAVRPKKEANKSRIDRVQLTGDFMTETWSMAAAWSVDPQQFGSEGGGLYNGQDKSDFIQVRMSLAYSKYQRQ